MEWNFQEIYHDQNVDRRKVFIGLKIKLRFVFDVKYTNDAGIYFRVALWINTDVVELI